MCCFSGISAMSVRDRFRRSAQACCHRMCRRKRHQTDTSASDTQHYHSVYDLLNVGLGSVLAMAVYIMVAPVAVHLTGPAIVVSVILAAVAGVMSGGHTGMAQHGTQIYCIHVPQYELSMYCNYACTRIHAHARYQTKCRSVFRPGPLHFFSLH